jgi:dTDP-4-dehydrorhamnose reductase
MRALIIGGTGQLGTALQRSVPSGCTVIAPPRSTLDLEHGASIETGVREAKPDLIILAGGFTDVEAAERQPALAMRINGDGTAHVAEAAARHGARLIAVSSDYVFDGRARTPYKPDAPTNPLSAYGRSKLQGEREALSRTPASVVLRTAWLYGPTGRNFVRTMFSRMATGTPVRVVNDQTGSPTSTASVARVIWRAAERPDVTGVHHLTDSGSASWYDFAVAIGAEATAAGILSAVPDVVAIASTEYSSAAPRPAYSVLDTSITTAALAVQATPWRDALRDVVREISRAAA